MSFGIGVGDIIQVSRLAWGLYRSCRDSSEDFRRISTEIGALHVVLRETEDFVRESPELDAERRRRLSVLLDGCDSSLKDLQKLLDSYESLGTQAQRTWDRMRWGLTDVSDVRSRLISNATLLGAFTSTLANSSTARMEKRLQKFITEVKAGLREGSVVTAPDAAETIDTPGVWDELRRELEDIGISEVVIEENKAHIKSWFRAVLQQQQTPGDGDEILSLGGDDALTLVASCDESISGQDTGTSRRSNNVASMTSANEEFAKELKRRGAADEGARAVDDSFGAMALGGGEGDGMGRRKSSSASSMLVKKKAAPTRMLMKLLKKEDAIIEAASDGDIAKVAKLISLGMDVNARDRWGWSALSMCGYGGHTDIARLLLDHGANLDNVDVDGETPENLATNRGNREMVLLFEEERSARDLKARELDVEKPRPVEM